MTRPKFTLIRTEQTSIYTPSLADVRAAERERRADAMIAVGILVAVAAASLWCFLTAPVGGAVL